MHYLHSRGNYRLFRPTSRLPKARGWLNLHLLSDDSLFSEAVSILLAKPKQKDHSSLTFVRCNASSQKSVATAALMNSGTM